MLCGHLKHSSHHLDEEGVTLLQRQDMAERQRSPALARLLVGNLKRTKMSRPSEGPLLCSGIARERKLSSQFHWPRDRQANRKG